MKIVNSKTFESSRRLYLLLHRKSKKIEIAIVEKGRVFHFIRKAYLIANVVDLNTGAFMHDDSCHTSGNCNHGKKCVLSVNWARFPMCLQNV